MKVPLGGSERPALRGAGARTDHPRTILLGAQGATASDLPAVFGTALPWVLPSASRSLSGAGPDRSSIVRAVQAEVAALRKVVS